MSSFRNCLKRLGGGQASDHQATHGRIAHRLPGFTEPFLLFAQGPALAKPRQSPFHYPPPRKHCKSRTRSGLPLLAEEDTSGWRPHSFGHPASLLFNPVCALPRAIVACIKHTGARRGNWAVVCLGGSNRSIPSRSITSVGWTFTVKTKPCVSTSR
jgi:hypothetical protein